jgi:UDP-N-acetylmuramate: L-alanyl-gamma-D-glutamyl-meso-diaminopimelate ligase
MAAARHVGVPVAQAAESLSRFQNVKRRMEVRGQVNGVTVYDDFAHHPTAIATTVGGLRQKLGTGGRILAVLEPRSNTMKLGAMKDALPGSLKEADLVFGFGSQQALGWSLADALKPMGAIAHTFDQIDYMVQAIVQAAQPGDHILVMSNGGFGGIHQKLLQALAR